MSIEDQFLKQLASGAELSQDEYDQMGQDLPPEMIAAALVRRFEHTQEIQTLIQAARLYLHAGYDYEVLEICGRYPRVSEFQKMVHGILPRVREDYPDIQMIGKLLEEAFIVVNLDNGTIVRFPPLLPARG